MTAVAFVLLDKAHLPPAPDLMERLRQRDGRHYRLEEMAPAGPRDLPTTSFRMDEDEALVVLMDVPVPWQDLEEPCATALWSKAKELCVKHKAHLIVAVRGETGDLIGQHLRLTDLIAAVLEATAAPVVYWGAARAVHPGGVFREMAFIASREFLPLHLWLNFRVVRREGGEKLVATTGMKEYGIMEIEGASRRLEPQALRDQAFGAAQYLLDRGPVLKDGDTLGAGTRERIPVHHRESVFEGRGTVIWLDFDQAPQPGLFARLWRRIFPR